MVDVHRLRPGLAGVICGLSIALPGSLLTAAPEDEARRARAYLAEARVPPALDTLLGVVRRRILLPDDATKIRAAVSELASDSFRRREAATAALAAIGLKAAPAVAAAQAAASDPEVRTRLEHILRQLDRRRDDRLLWSAIVELRERRHAQAVQPLLQLLPTIRGRHLLAPCREAIWASATPQHVELLRETMRSGRAVQLAAALVALDKVAADPAAAVERKDHDAASVRLAVARVLARHQPRVAAALLAELRGCSQRGVQAEAEYLLQLLYTSAERREAPTRNRPEQWRTWLATTDKRLVPLDNRRFRCGQLHLGIREDFAADSSGASDEYGPFVYQSTAPSRFAVRGGRLYLEGEHPECDQRLAVSAERIAGAPVLTRPLTVEARLGGQPGNEVGWHVGISVGNVKALFHPGYTAGAFRLETVDKHQFLLQNQSMPFTPASGKMHKMRLKVTPQRDGGALIAVRVEDADSSKSFEAKMAVSKQQIGPLDRVGLERSGRAGGAAMFDDVEVNLE